MEINEKIQIFLIKNLTDRAQRTFLDDSETAVMNSKMLNDKTKKNEALKFWQVVVSQFEIENDSFRLSFQDVHGSAYVRVICGFADDIETESFDGADTWRNRDVGWARL